MSHETVKSVLIIEVPRHVCNFIGRSKRVTNSWNVFVTVKYTNGFKQTSCSRNNKAMHVYRRDGDTTFRNNHRCFLSLHISVMGDFNSFVTCPFIHLLSSRIRFLSCWCHSNIVVTLIATASGKFLFFGGGDFCYYPHHSKCVPG